MCSYHCQTMYWYCTSRLLKKARTKSEFCNDFVQFINVPQCLFIFDVVFLGIWFLWIKKQIVPFSSFFLLAAQTIGSYDKYAFWVSILFLYFFLKFLLEAFSSPFIRTVILCNVLDSVICNTVLFQSFILVFSFSEQDIVLSVVRKLGGFFIEDRVSSSTSHVIAGSPRRTLNVLMAIAQGCWLVSPMWVRKLWNAYTTLDIHVEHECIASTGLIVHAGRVGACRKLCGSTTRNFLVFGLFETSFVIPCAKRGLGEDGGHNNLIHRCLVKMP